MRLPCDIGFFAETWLRSPVLRPGKGIHAAVGNHVGVMLYQDHRFQVQLWACPKNSEIPDHAHPGLRGYAVRVGGSIRFRRGGQWVTRADTIPMIFAGKYTMAHLIEPGVTHGATIGDTGASFLAIAEFLEGPPQSVHLAWAGEPLDLAHAKELRCS